VVLSGVEVDELRDLIVDAYSLAAPRKLAVEARSAIGPRT
jgi:predicted DNA-binding protein (MmcQ/YjbR family)